MTNPNVPKSIDVFEDKNVQPDKPYCGTTEVAFAQATEALAYRGVAPSLNLFWPQATPFYTEGGSCPMAQITAVDTWTAFQQGPSVAVAALYQHDFEVPWRHMESYNAIGAMIVIGFMHAADFDVRISGKTMIDSVSTANGDPTRMRYYFHNAHDSMLMFESRWMLNEQSRRPRFASAVCDLYSPNVPANRRILVAPEIRVNTAEALIDLGGTIDVYMRQMMIFGIPGGGVDP